MTEPTGRRERKKARTRKSLADAALRLFLERGYDQVGVKDVADEADVSVTTLFKHFPSKEALVFDLDDDLEEGLVAAVRGRAPGQSIPQALREHFLAHEGPQADPRFAAFLRLVEETPALREYQDRMWMRHEAALARVIAEEIGAPKDDVTCAVLAHFALAARGFIQRYPERDRAAGSVFAFLDRGWEAVAADRSRL